MSAFIPESINNFIKHKVSSSESIIPISIFQFSKESKLDINNDTIKLFIHDTEIKSHVSINAQLLDWIGYEGEYESNRAKFIDIIIRSNVPMFDINIKEYDIKLHEKHLVDIFIRVLDLSKLLNIINSSLAIERQRELSKLIQLQSSYYIYTSQIEKRKLQMELADSLQRESKLRGQLELLHESKKYNELKPIVNKTGYINCIQLSLKNEYKIVESKDKLSTVYIHLYLSSVALEFIKAVLVSYVCKSDEIYNCNIETIQYIFKIALALDENTKNIYNDAINYNNDTSNRQVKGKTKKTYINCDNITVDIARDLISKISLDGYTSTNKIKVKELQKKLNEVTHPYLKLTIVRNITRLADIEKIVD